MLQDLCMLPSSPTDVKVSCEVTVGFRPTWIEGSGLQALASKRAPPSGFDGIS
jgi:hypothetical protein